MRNWGPDVDVAVLLFAVVAVVVVVPTAVVVRHRRGHVAPGLVAAVTGTVLYVFGILAFTLFPLPADQADACRHTTAGWHVVPLRSILDALRFADLVGPAEFLVSTAFLQLLLNVAVLVPVGVVIGWRTSRPVWVALAIGFGISLAIEVTQGTGIFGIFRCPYRYGEIDDLLANTAGAAIGWVVGRVVSLRTPGTGVGRAGA